MWFQTGCVSRAVGYPPLPSTRHTQSTPIYQLNEESLLLWVTSLAVGLLPSQEVVHASIDVS